jgi:hypothetical protein
LREAGASRLAPSPRPTHDAPGPTLWARCEATETLGVYIGTQRVSQDFAARVQIKIHTSLSVRGT